MAAVAPGMNILFIKLLPNNVIKKWLKKLLQRLLYLVLFQTICYHKYVTFSLNKTILLVNYSESIDEIVETRAWLDAHPIAISLSVNELVLIIAQQHEST